LTWVRAAMRGHGPDVVVSDIERRLDATQDAGAAPRGSSLALLHAVARSWPLARVRLVVGSDIIESKETARWHRWEEIERRFDPIVVPRGGHSSGAFALPEISSREVRAALERDDPGGRALLRAAVPRRVLAQLGVATTKGSLLLIGTGNVATHAEGWLREEGWGVQTISGRAFGAGDVSIPSTRLDGVWVLVGDPQIPAVADRLANAGLDPTTPVLHGAGAVRADSELGLAVLHAAGSSVGTLHPICALRREVDQDLLDRCAFGVEGDVAAMALVDRIVPRARQIALGALTASDRVRYHAACALAANFVGAFRVLAARELDAVGVEGDQGRDAISVLMESSLFNLSRLGFPAGVTGPVSRGDAAAVERHTHELQGAAREVYEVMTKVLKGLLASAPEA